MRGVRISEKNELHIFSENSRRQRIFGSGRRGPPAPCFRLVDSHRVFALDGWRRAARTWFSRVERLKRLREIRKRGAKFESG